MKLKIAAITCALALMAGGAYAAQGQTWIGLTVHGDMPMGDFGDAAGFGFGGTASGTYMVSEMFGVGADVGYHTWGGSDDLNAALTALDQLAGGTGEVEASYSAIQFGAHGKYVIQTANEKMIPYLKAGVGMYNFSVKFDGHDFITEPDSESDFGFNLGCGLDFMASENYTIGGQVAFHTVQTEGDATNFITIGVGVNFGVGGK
jgi:opacity protein-like surface antigen